jgi:hypothetical protein
MTGFRQRMFAVTGALVGLLGPTLFAMVARGLSWGQATAAFLLYLAVAIPFALFLWWVTRKTGPERL